MTEALTVRATSEIAATGPALAVCLRQAVRRYIVPALILCCVLAMSMVAFAEGETTASTTLQGVVTQDMIKGVLNEIIGLLPVVLPTMIGFIALRKGISFVMGMLHSA